MPNLCRGLGPEVDGAPLASLSVAEGLRWGPCFVMVAPVSRPDYACCREPLEGLDISLGQPEGSAGSLEEVQLGQIRRITLKHSERLLLEELWEVGEAALGEEVCHFRESGLRATQPTRMPVINIDDLTDKDKLKMEVEQLKKEVKLERELVSKMCEEIKTYIEGQSGEDPLVKGIPEDKNPFKEKGGCIIA
ncbi:hypothetical protein NDU88_006159 [Pleurodeles waltl]|uniref:Guanine nucleotide-binding protein subunit gamma n=2 Tax=Pleurodeles waltl TaxID=8319 RepID=A0AAV7MBF2_PLEWA|nr:hypothetical protein NDU88_006159 [Pleurodeles waltl]